MFLPLIPC